MLQHVGAIHFDIVVFRVAGGLHPFDEEHTALLCFGVVTEGLVALFGKAACILACSVVVFFFAFAEKSAVLFALIAPAHLATAVEHAYATARNQDVELSLLNIATDVGRHDDELLALELLGVGVGGAVVAFAGKGELEALSALATVGSRRARLQRRMPYRNSRQS